MCLDREFLSSLNKLANLYLNSVIINWYICDVLEREPELELISKKYQKRKLTALTNAQKIINFLCSHGDGFVLSEPTFLRMLSCEKADQLSLTIGDTLQDLHAEAEKADEILVSRFVKSLIEREQSSAEPGGADRPEVPVKTSQSSDEPLKDDQDDDDEVTPESGSKLPTSSRPAKRPSKVTKAKKKRPGKRGSKSKKEDLSSDPSSKSEKERLTGLSPGHKDGKQPATSIDTDPSSSDTEAKLPDVPSESPSSSSDDPKSKSDQDSNLTDFEPASEESSWATNLKETLGRTKGDEDERHSTGEDSASLSKDTKTPEDSKAGSRMSKQSFKSTPGSNAGDPAASDEVNKSQVASSKSSPSISDWSSAESELETESTKAAEKGLNSGRPKDDPEEQRRLSSSESESFESLSEDESPKSGSRQSKQSSKETPARSSDGVKTQVKTPKSLPPTTDKPSADQTQDSTFLSSGSSSPRLSDQSAESREFDSWPKFQLKKKADLSFSLVLDENLSPEAMAGINRILDYLRHDHPEAKVRLAKSSSNQLPDLAIVCGSDKTLFRANLLYTDQVPILGFRTENSKSSLEFSLDDDEPEEIFGSLFRGNMVLEPVHRLTCSWPSKNGPQEVCSISNLEQGVQLQPGDIVKVSMTRSLVIKKSNSS